MLVFLARGRVFLQNVDIYLQIHIVLQTHVININIFTTVKTQISDKKLFLNTLYTRAPLNNSKMHLTSLHFKLLSDINIFVLMSGHGFSV